VAAGNAAADDVDDLPELDAQGDFDEAGVLDASGEREDLGAFAALRAHVEEPLAAVADNGGDVGVGLDVVDERGLAPEAADGGIGRARLGGAAATFNGGQQGGFLAADKGAGAEADLDIEVELGIADGIAEQAAATRFANGDTATGYSART
jgi:hypothetical protein